jgi:hypothetical protein
VNGHAGPAEAIVPHDRVARLLLPAASVGLFVLTVSLILLAAGSSLGYDYRCYEGAARSLVDGKAVYDNAFSITVGTCPGTFTYPPPFAVALVPWLLLGSSGSAAWCVAMAGCFLLGIALLPVRRETRCWLLVVAALDWPVLYAIKLGQVGPILFLLFAIAWRWMDRGSVVGATAAVGVMVKVQPGLLAIWALATRRYRAAAGAALIAVAIVAATLPFAGFGAWATYADLLRGLGGTLSTAHDFAPGAVAYQAGADGSTATIVQLASNIAALGGLLLAWRYASPELSLMATIVASQLLSAPLRDHYALLLLLPTAWLLERGRTWSIMLPLSAWISVLAFPVAATSATGSSAGLAVGSGSWVAAASIPLAFFGCLAVLLVEALLERRPNEDPPRIDSPSESSAAG